MSYSDDQLSDIIMRYDPTADAWVYNRYCSFCARFIYPGEDNKPCKKCKYDTSKAIKRSIPFLSSATALEKLLSWFRSRSITYSDRDGINNQIIDIISEWLRSPTITTAAYHQAIVNLIGNRLATQINDDLAAIACLKRGQKPSSGTEWANRLASSLTKPND